MTSALAQILIEEEHYLIKDALDVIYNSITFKNLQNTETGFYYQSVGYIYSFLQEEISQH